MCWYRVWGGRGGDGPEYLGGMRAGGAVKEPGLVAARIGDGIRGVQIRSRYGRGGSAAVELGGGILFLARGRASRSLGVFGLVRVKGG